MKKYFGRLSARVWSEKGQKYFGRLFFLSKNKMEDLGFVVVFLRPKGAKGGFAGVFLRISENSHNSSTYIYNI